ncbi:hypothetical protein EVAR_66043_1 [Eumeta japonica]|uniref:Uncharacterized protein n=1 Tax=Eumeta variegata TaxID=151549 RepID=A0A4C1ZZ02_EUMVA|nr:hypothetical protein EVAR_66043_1 [Eumeta japonica]
MYTRNAQRSHQALPALLGRNRIFDAVAPSASDTRRDLNKSTTVPKAYIRAFFSLGPRKLANLSRFGVGQREPLDSTNGPNANTYTSNGVAGGGGRYKLPCGMR